MKRTVVGAVVAALVGVVHVGCVGAEGPVDRGSGTVLRGAPDIPQSEGDCIINSVGVQECAAAGGCTNFRYESTRGYRCCSLCGEGEPSCEYCD